MIDPNVTLETRQKNELFQCFRRGFKHGASANAQDRRFLEHARPEVISAYQRGYERGRSASYIAAADECERLQYDPQMSILRSPSPTEPPR